MSFLSFSRFCFICLFAVFWNAGAQGFELAAHKDRLFAYPAVLSSSDGGAYRVVDYQEMRDINGRDAVPERRVDGRYVSTGVRRAQQELALQTEAGTVRYFAVGKSRGASAIVLYLHGQGGNRRQGVNDFTFGGNFNRIKNLMVKSGGLYLSPDVADFEALGTRQIAALISHYAASSPGARVFVACGSMGGALCWRLAQDGQTVRQLGGLLLLGSMWNEAFLQSPAFAARVPVFFGHGSADRVFPVGKQEAFFRKIRSASGEYPARFVRFETGTHGTPIRMTDWRETLNWMLAER
ncbi:alpha/beta hydrolase [Nitratireductor sp. L1-7-SE]|uniref:Alpha/beta hydrolase n=1 Tax=Nitratireductor rhodophyticola TaxID=2854036 RepID=A0ABS7R2D0_9HYPH|nr:alpha/beta hydrolase [Nitratireductor rhodophyticola]MBY8915091.1 alpha/beta hydrolase [Nitratireductor rhodophyticola]MBY8919839.1 alpha/beta hydrolase [Nitratireductor rhodophyticola]